MDEYRIKVLKEMCVSVDKKIEAFENAPSDAALIGKLTELKNHKQFLEQLILELEEKNSHE